MNTTIWNAGYLTLMFLALFGIAEWLYHKRHWAAETTRKIVHIGTGLLSLLFPVMLANHWLVLILCSAFLLILLLSLHYKLLPSINAIDRKSAGSLAFPVAVYGCYLVYNWQQQQYIYYYLPILILGLCDPAAAFVGRRLPKGKFSVRADAKTLSGSGAFFVVAFLLSVALSIFASAQSAVAPVMVTALLVALLSSIAEALSGKGYDNLTIPAAVLAALAMSNELYL